MVGHGIGATLLGLTIAVPVMGAPAAPELVVQAREAWKSTDKKRRAELPRLAAAARQQADPLAPWVDYFDLNARLITLSQPDLDAFYARWPGSYVEDRLRNDWLLELGRRRDFEGFRANHAAYKMQDDREVACYALLTQAVLDSKVSIEAAHAAWLAQKEADDGCQALAAAMLEARAFKHEHIWAKARLATEQNRPKAARQAVALLSTGKDKQLAALQDNAGRYLTRQARSHSRDDAELTTLALARVAANDPAQAAGLLRDTWAAKLPADLQAWLWGQIGRQYAWRLQADAGEAFGQAFKLKPDGPWSDELLGAATRAALRARDWPAALQAMGRMSAAEQRQLGWQFWRAQALQASGKTEEGRTQLAGVAAQGGGLAFFPRLAAELLGQAPRLPTPPAPLTPEEREAARAHAGLQRALRLIDLGLRSEGLREWNFSMRGLSDRQLLAAAQEACDREVWDRCISASERTRTEIDLTQRYPTPYRAALLATSRDVGVDPGYVYGLIRQESRFVVDARSHVGAGGLMQVMPATARWTAKKAGMPYSPALVHDPDYNLRLGTSYLKLVLDAFEGSQALAAAAYNAGPSRPRRWREGPVLDAAIWTENIPFNETRDYVRNVLANGSVYAQLLGQGATSLRERLGATIGPAKAVDDAANVPPPPADLP